jgi:ATP-binding protein involved in chromosome partitioning
LVVTGDDVLALLRGVIDPELGSDIVDLGMVRSAAVSDDGVVTIEIALTTAGCPLKHQIDRDVTAKVGGSPGVRDVAITWSEMTAEEKATCMAKARWNATQRATGGAIPPAARVIAIASGKGGVGKSSVTANLATGLAAEGHAVGVVDADIGGFSMPRLLGIDGRLNAVEGDRAKIAPHVKHVGAGRIEVVSMGFLVDDEQTALVWRGQTLNRAVQHFFEDVRWSDDLDYLLIDMPPGTGDIQIGLARLIPRAEMLVVTTPGRNVQAVAERAADLARKTYLHVAGVIENMAAFTCEHGSTYALFGEGGGEELAERIGAPLLGSVPLEAAVAAGSDAGAPAVLGEGPAADALRAIVRRVIDDIAPPVSMSSCSARLLERVEAAFSDGA